MAGYMIMIVFWAIENNLVYLKAILVYDCESFLGYWVITKFIFNCSVIVSWAIANNLVYLRVILVRPVIVIVFWSYPPVGL